MFSRIKSFFAHRGDGFHAPARIFWVAFVVRVLIMTIAHKYKLHVELNDHFEFGFEMGRVARALANGYGFADPFGGHTGPTAWVPPLYPLILALVFKVFGVYTLKSAWVILTLNSVFSASIAPAVYQIGLRCFGCDESGLKVALWSGWLWALYPAALQYAIHWVWEMSLSAALLTWIVVLALRIRGVGEINLPSGANQTSKRWCLFGLLWGVLALSNSSLLLFLPFCGAWAIWPELSGNFSRALRNCAVATVCCTVLLTPWVARNWFAFHVFVPMRTNFGAELFEAARFSNEGFPTMATLSSAEKDPDVQRYRRLGEVAYCKQQGERAMVIIRQHPDIFLAHAVKRVLFFWEGVPNPVYDGKSLLAELIREVNYGFLTIGGALGMGLALKRRVPGAWLFFWAFLSIPFLYYFISVQARFRHPLEPLITILTVFLFQSAEPARSKSRTNSYAHD